jgi:diguanylate cyclase (GGDEF)-like protein
MSSHEISHQFFRIDPLTNCQNLLSFLEAVSRAFTAAPMPALSLMALDVNFFEHLNRIAGHEQGDDALRWIAMVLAEETRAPVYRTGGDEFVLLLEQGTEAERVALAQRAFARLNGEAAKFGLPEPAASIALLHYTGDKRFEPADVLVQMGAAVFAVKQSGNRAFAEFTADSMQLPPHPQSIITNMINRIVSFGVMLDNWRELAYTDPVSGLPNSRAAQQQLDATLVAAGSDKPFVVLFIDGDNLRRYNEVSYAAGDEMIRRLSQLLKNQLRPTDFIARWRVGDEFLIVLPQTALEHAVAVAERLCQIVQQSSQTWEFPVTISLGIAAYPHHGATVAELLMQAEAGVEAAKAQGKNCVVVPPALPTP